MIVIGAWYIVLAWQSATIPKRPLTYCRTFFSGYSALQRASIPIDPWNPGFTG
jgi:hypothetical protein